MRWWRSAVARRDFPARGPSGAAHRARSHLGYHPSGSFCAQGYGFFCIGDDLLFTRTRVASLRHPLSWLSRLAASWRLRPWPSSVRPKPSDVGLAHLRGMVGKAQRTRWRAGGGGSATAQSGAHRDPRSPGAKSGGTRACPTASPVSPCPGQPAWAMIAASLDDVDGIGAVDRRDKHQHFRRIVETCRGA